MDTIHYRLKLLDLKNWYENVVDRRAERATLDSQSNFEFRLALAKLAAVEHNLKRLDRGQFGRCEVCGIGIPGERLDMLLENDDHWCIQCAANHGVPNRQVSAVKAVKQPFRLTSSITAFAPA